MAARKPTRSLLEEEQRLLAAKELQTRRMNALRLFRPQAHQEPYFRSTTNFVLLSGGNRSGKTTAMLAKFAAFAQKLKITLTNGEMIDVCPKEWENTPLLMWLVGLNWPHIGQTLYSKLFEPGLFNIIYDRRIGDWRTADETDPYDQENRQFWQPSPPLIPPTEYTEDSWSWDDQTKHQFSEVRLRNGTTIRAYPSTGMLKQGDNVHVIGIDEQIADDNGFGEYRARVAQSNGYIWWSTWPTFEHDEAQARLRDLCQDQANKPNPIAVEINLDTADNKFMNDRAMELLLAGLSDEEKAARGSGLTNAASRRIYPAYRTEIHSTEPLEVSRHDALTKALEHHTATIPGEWCIYLIIDPGTAHPAVLFVAVPPPPLHRFVVPYDEVYGERGDAYKMAREVADKLAGRKPQGIIIDGQAAQQEAMGFGKTVLSQYMEAYASQRITSYATGASFWKGSNNIKSRQLKLTAMMEPDPLLQHTPRLRIQTGRCPYLRQQLLKARRAEVKKIPQEGTYARQAVDLLQCLEYYAGRDPGYVAPPVEYIPVDEADQWFMDHFKKQRNNNRGDNSVYCGPR